ncbi:hypothetical protein [Luedemannella helvata]|uniref:Amino acid--[acyl-carrier-protein] ligase n=1 Tax=Luedemannella helvata TaxID=349315 RepID=A0ABN2JUN8_9ACTN
MLTGRDLRDTLHRDGYLFPGSVAGIYGTDGRFERMLAALSATLSSLAGEAGARHLRFPPAVRADDLARVGYARAFPHLAAAISVCARPDAAAWGADPAGWTDLLEPSELALRPAACYAVYPHLAHSTVATAVRFDTMGYCFRREPSDDPFRMQYFRMHEVVFVGPDAAVGAFLTWAHDTARALFDQLGLPVDRCPATDPFFGPGGRVLAAEQRERDLKQEYVLRGAGVALASVNHHETHFTRPYAIGGGAVSACVGFGLERAVLAAFAHHGTDPAAWPSAARAVVGLAGSA